MSLRTVPVERVPDQLTTEYHERLIKKTRGTGTSVEGARLGMLLLWLADDMQDSVNADLEEFGITENKLGMLIILYLAASEFNRSVTPSELADLVGVERASVTGILDWLEQRKFIVRKPESSDRRKIHVTLSNSGKARFHRILKGYWEACDRISRHLTASEQATFEKLTTKLLKGIKVDQKKKKKT